MTSWEVAGCTFRCETYCPDHILTAMTATEDFAQWRLGEFSYDVEANLDEIAAHHDIDRMDESTYDSMEFPKVIFADMAEDSACDTCPGRLTLI